MNNKQYRYIFGVDPDCSKSGVAIWDRQEKTLSLHEFDLFDLSDFLIAQKECPNNEPCLFVRLEAGHLMKGMWHKGGTGAAKRVGANFEICRQIEKLLQRLEIPYELVPPKGYSSYDHEKFCAITGWPISKKTNPEKRAAAMFCYKY